MQVVPAKRLVEARPFTAKDRDLFEVELMTRSWSVYWIRKQLYPKKLTSSFETGVAAGALTEAFKVSEDLLEDATDSVVQGFMQRKLWRDDKEFVQGLEQGFKEGQDSDDRPLVSHTLFLDRDVPGWSINKQVMSDHCATGDLATENAQHERWTQFASSSQIVTSGTCPIHLQPAIDEGEEIKIKPMSSQDLSDNGVIIVRNDQSSTPTEFGMRDPPQDSAKRMMTRNDHRKADLASTLPEFFYEETMQRRLDRGDERTPSSLGYTPRELGDAIRKGYLGMSMYLSDSVSIAHNAEE